MGNSLTKFYVGALLAATICSALAAQERARSEAFELNADSLTFNRQTNLLEARHARIVRGNVRVEADESVANGVDFEQSTEWRFKGHVKINVDTAVLEAESAVFTFDSKQLSRADLEGAPASFTDLASTQQKPVSGGARKLTYDNVARTLELSDDAWINKDEAEFRSCGLIYDFNVKRVTSGPTDCGVRLLLPQKLKPKAPPASPPQ
jgi:lipopolysaccharide transport protein LptA